MRLLLGLLGTVFLVFSLSYSFFKRILSLNNKVFLNIHVFAGTIGSILILLHTDFKFGGIAGFAFACLAVTFFSGFIGRYIFPNLNKDGDLFKLLGFWHPIHVYFSVLMIFVSITHILIVILFKV